MKFMQASLPLVCAVFFCAVQTFAQFPYAGTIVEEVPIPPDVAADIAAEAGFVNEPKCYRVYVCLQQSDFAVIQLFTSLPFNILESTWEVSCPECQGSSQFYQSDFGTTFGSQVFTALYDFIPSLQYDSWWSIGDEGNIGYTGTTSGIGTQMLAAEASFNSGGAWYTDDGLATVFVQGSNACWSLPDEQGRVLIGQFTTDGLFYGNVAITLSRRTAAPCLPATPIEAFIVNNVSFSNDPAVQQACYCDPNFITGCLDQEACNFNPDANCDSGDCSYPEPFKDCDGSCLLDFNQNGVCDQEELSGCTYSNALNFNPEATIDDASCQFGCEGDFNNDGSVSVSDLLPFLGAFGSDCVPQ